MDGPVHTGWQAQLVGNKMQHYTGHFSTGIMLIDKRLKAAIVRWFLGYDATTLEKTLLKLGLRPGDSLMVHASWLPNNGFRGKPLDFINALKTTLGPHGLLAMTSLTYQNESSRRFLERGEAMNVRRSPSQMGLLTEVFRRGRDTRRSLSPTHPILAAGEKAEAFLEGHEHCQVPFGAHSPFDRLREWGGKILTVDAPFSTITYTHYLENRIAEALPFPLYETETMQGTVIDYEGRRFEVPVKVLSDQANRLRREARLVAELDKAQLIRRTRVGNTRLMLIDARRMADHVEAWVAAGGSFFDAP